MPDDNSHAMIAGNGSQDLTTMPLAQALDAYTPNFSAVLPPNISVDHFKRMVVSALNTSPELWSADRRTLFNACVKCASDGLLPDGREAALVVFRTKVKDRQGREHWIDAAQYLPMIAGIRKRMRNSGEVASATAEVVYRNDRFHYRLGPDATIEHEPAGLDQEPGDPIGAYAIIKLSSGEIIYEVMRLKEIDRVRSFSRAKDGPAWRNWWGEMARKTALKRAAKAVPQAAALERLLLRDDEAPELPPADTLPLVPPRPQRSEFLPPHDPESGEILEEEVRDVEESGQEGGPPTQTGDPGQGATEPVEVEERADFWRQDKLFVAKVNGAKGHADWRRTHAQLLYWVNDAWTADEVRKLRTDSRMTIDGLKLADERLWRDANGAIDGRIAELSDARPVAAQ